MTKKKKTKSKFSKLERFIYKSCTVISVFLILGIVFGRTTLSKMNLEVQNLSIKVSNQEDTNQSLTMKINEMASLENIQNISEDMGLAYNNENIKTITE